MRASHEIDIIIKRLFEGWRMKKVVLCTSLTEKLMKYSGYENIFLFNHDYIRKYFYVLDSLEKL